VPFDQAAAICFGGLTALHFLRKTNVRAGERVLVNGASGAVGVAAVQIARDMGAHVTGVASGANEALVRSLGAERFIDYTREDFADGRDNWDVIIDNAGTAPFARSRRALAKGGRLGIVLGTLGDMLRAPMQSLTSDLNVSTGGSPERVEDMRYLAQLAAEGRVNAVIDSTYPLERIVDAHRRVDSGHKRGSVVVIVGKPDGGG
jgi:NADPH:quinone reductase-like Zn-dependent oxidoreductase